MPVLEPSAVWTFADNDVQLTLKVSVSSPPKLLSVVATMSPVSESPSLSLIEIEPVFELFVVNMTVNMSVPSKLLCRPIPLVVKPPLLLLVTVPVHALLAGAPHAKSMEPAFALGTNTETANKQATARPDLRIILTMVSSPRNLSGRAATEKSPTT